MQEQKRLEIWWYLLPFVALMTISVFHPKPPDDVFDTEIFRLEYGRQQAVFVTVQALVLTCLGLAAARILNRVCRFRVTSFAVAVGILGLVLWIGLTHFRWESQLIEFFGLARSLPGRSALDPWKYFEAGVWRNLFFSSRFLVLGLLVPLAEELFLRGFLLPNFESPDSQQPLSLKAVSWRGLMLVSVYAVLTHPHEALAALVWFGLISWLMKRTGNLWDCIVAHAVTNILLGLYILATGKWFLW